MSGDRVPVHVHKDEIIEKYSDSYRKLLRILKPLENSYKVIFNEDELAYILSIIYKL